MVGTSGHEPGITRRPEVTAADRQAAAARQRRNDIALWRWALTEPAMDPALTSRQRGAVVRDLEARELTTRPGGEPPEAFGRFQADTVNEIWTADFMNGPDIGGKPSFLAGIIDDRSRFLTGARFVRRTDAVRFAGVLRAAVAAHGIPSVLYCDNGSAFIDSSLERACAVLGMKLTHSAPSRPMGRGKIERVFGVIQQQFLVEISGDPDGGSPARHPAASLEELNGLLAAWLRTVYHARPHSETGQAPAAR